MITYNHEKFISQAIEGVLAQRTDFFTELIIADDFSLDRTKEICSKYKNQYPEKIQLLPREKNLGMILNFLSALGSCKGKYIALCEGDDYWTDPLKLQKQIDFLEANPDFAICFHRVKVFDEANPEKSHISNQNQKEITNFEDLADGNYIHTPSCVFRNKLLSEFPDWFTRLKLGDWVLHLLNANHGKIKFLEDVMAVYRVHDAGAWSTKPRRETYKNTLEAIDYLKKHFYPKGRENFDKFSFKINLELFEESFQDGNYRDARESFKKLPKNERKQYSKTHKGLKRRFVLSYFPGIADFYKNTFRRFRESQNS